MARLQNPFNAVENGQMAQLQQVAADIWVAWHPLRFLGLHLGTRMTVVRLSSGALLLHSPVALSPELRAEIDALGPVAHIVCPNYYHHLYAGEAQAAWPSALLHGPRELWRKRPDLKFGAALSEVPHADWQDDFELLVIAGCLARETVFFHRSTQTLITSDLFENFQTSAHGPTRFYLKLSGLHGRISTGRLLRWVYRDRKAARGSIERLLKWPFERIVIAHGDIVTRDAHQAVREGFAWL